MAYKIKHKKIDLSFKEYLQITGKEKISKNKLEKLKAKLKRKFK